ncbi:MULTISPECIES: hypothetical protein [Bacteria]|uniref:hypothetical protein n=1 Tax=Bacteria TaxID=2 RepID=UPI0014048E91|nr:MULTISPECIES: hypothetical protein [Bacteria]
MLQDWAKGPVGNTPATIVGGAKRETLAEVMVRALRPARAERPGREMTRAA